MILLVNSVTELIRGLYNIKEQHRGCVATIGNFDGVHLGHQALLTCVKQKAKTLHCSSLLITFEPQPLEFFSPDKAVPRLTRFREKFYYLSQFGVDKVLVIPFNQSFAKLSAKDFCQEVLGKQLGIKHIIVGDDFRFGAGREGNVQFLQAMDSQSGFSVEIMPTILLEQERISSTRIREALIKADHSLAGRLLGRPYSMMGRVVYGNQLGRQLGFPTANIFLHRAVAPVQGIYAVRMHGISREGLPGVANVGTRPTIGGTRTILEVHLFDFNETIYGKYVSVEFCKKQRDEERYDNLELLRQQIEKDALLARSYFYD
jgi:riboflavin kinase/FMN adenylyltransferase